MENQDLFAQAIVSFRNLYYDVINKNYHSLHKKDPIPIYLTTIWYTLPLRELNAYVNDWYNLHQYKANPILPNLTVYAPRKTLQVEGDLNTNVLTNFIELKDKLTVNISITNLFVILELKWLRFVTPEQKIRKLHDCMAPRKLQRVKNDEDS